jgi:hypothetical protein
LIIFGDREDFKEKPVMTEPVMALYEEQTLSFDVPDAALELAGSKCGDGPAASATIAFCSGVDSCPSLPAR